MSKRKSPIYVPQLQPLKATTGVEAGRVILRIESGRKTETFAMPPQAAVQIANALHRAAHDAQEQINAARSQR